MAGKLVADLNTKKSIAKSLLVGPLGFTCVCGWPKVSGIGGVKMDEPLIRKSP